MEFKDLVEMVQELMYQIGFKERKSNNKAKTRPFIFLEIAQKIESFFFDYVR